jgi:hypothetical protein
MKLELKRINGSELVEIISDEILIKDTQDALDLMANVRYQHGLNKLIMKEKNFVAAFFDLKTGIAGEILQKFSNYDAYLAIIGDFSNYASKSLKDFIYESNKYGRINFVNSLEEAVEKLIKQK